MIGIGYWVVLGVFTVVGMLVSNRLKSKFAHYSKIGTRSGMSGKEIAEAMLSHYGIRGVQVVMGQGFYLIIIIRSTKQWHYLPKYIMEDQYLLLLWLHMSVDMPSNMILLTVCLLLDQN